MYYERALKVDPSYIDAQENLKIAHSSVLDNIESVPDFILITWITNIKNSLTSNSWAVITLILLFVLLGLLLMFRLMPTIKARKTSFVLACVVFVLSVSTFSFALSVKKDGTVENVTTTVSSGSKQIDTIVLQSVKAALKYVKAPTSEFKQDSYNFSLIINF